MVWGFSGSGTTVPLVGDARNRHLHDYYNAHPEIVEKYDNNVHAYIHQTSLKFSEEPGTQYVRESDPFGPIEDHEWPVEFQTNLSNEKFGKLKSLLDMRGGGSMLVVDQALKDIIEGLEPDVHQFRPVRLTTAFDEEFPERYYTLLIGQFLDSFSPEDSDSEMFTEKFDPINNRKLYFTMGGKETCAVLAMSRSVFGGAHLWREKCLNDPSFLLSKELRDAIRAAGLKVPPMYRMKEVA